MRSMLGFVISYSFHSRHLLIDKYKIAKLLFAAIKQNLTILVFREHSDANKKKLNTIAGLIRTRDSYFMNGALYYLSTTKGSPVFHFTS